MNYEFLNDKEFLHKIDTLHIKEQFLKMTILSWDERPIVEIQGKTTTGNLSIDGASSLRRTGSFTLQADKDYNNLENIDNIIAINRKVKLELGVKNSVPNEEIALSGLETKIINYVELYGDIIWFPLGIFVLFDPNISHTPEGLEISVSIRDKMCLLNGEAGGVIPAATTFSESEREDDTGKTIIEYPTLYQIIYECVNHFGNESLAKIIISDLELKAKQVMQYIGQGGIYFIQGLNITTGERFFTDYAKAVAAAVSLGGSADNVIHYDKGSDIGFIMTDFTYPGELTCNAGDTVTSVLDKIIAVLGNYEYFYDVYGNFHFQEIKNYLNTTFTTTLLDQLNKSLSYDMELSQGTSVYTFNGTEMLFSVSNSPLYSNIKNDFVVWGKRKSGADNTEYPIRYHLAIDKRPAVIGIDSRGEYYGIHEHILLQEDDYGVLRATKSNSGGVTIYTRDYREELYYQGLEAEVTGTDAPYYFTELKEEWPKIYYLAPNEQGFKDTVKAAAADMDFFLDILDVGSEVGRYSVDNIGRRSEVVVEDEINCIFETEVPDMVFINVDEYKDDPQQIDELINKYNAKGQDWYLVDDILMSNMAIGGVRNSAYYRVTDLLYQRTNMNNALALSCLPIYYLEPNTRISVYDKESGVSGDFVISSISLPLTIDGTMEISAYKAQQKI